MATKLPDYVASAKPVPLADRIPWYKSTAQTFAGIMLWFVFWHEVPMGSALFSGLPYAEHAGGTLAQGLVVALIGLVLAALICHFLFYLVPSLLGMKTGLPLYIVGTSTYGVIGGFLMPAFLMGVLQFGWVAVNGFFSSLLLCRPFGYEPLSTVHQVVATLWIVAALFVGLKGISYVARVATFIPLIPLIILLILFFSSVGGVADFDHETAFADVSGETVTSEESGEERTIKPPLSPLGVILLLGTYTVGFFATAGAAGADFGMNNRDARGVQLGGLVGVAGATVLAGGLALLIVAGAVGSGAVEDVGKLQATNLMSNVVGERTGAIFMYLLAIAAFPAACFASFIAANSFKTTLPKVNPFVSCGIGGVVAILLAVTGLAGDATGVFKIIGASFGPVCGAMAADYLLAGRKWPGPRAGFNLAGWISWVVGFIVGAADFIPGMAGLVPCPPVAAFVVGFLLYAGLAQLGLQGQTLEMPTTAEEPAGA
ncbi:MAG: cytosine permease [Planctomycetota bacterium]